MMKFRGSILFIAFFALSLMTVIAWAVYLPKTGQTTCYDDAGYELASCTSTGQDGELYKGIAWPDPRFTNPDGNPINGDIVLDRLTGLIWTKIANTPTEGACIGGALMWPDALAYIACLNSANYLGYNDWRLPNINELESLVNAGTSNTAAWLSGKGFLNVQASEYWSSTYYAGNPFDAWSLHMDSGVSEALEKTWYSLRVWPVRGPADAGAVQVPKTGQSKCYDASNPAVEIDCAGSGQDGEKQSGNIWPDPRYSVSYCGAAGPCATQFADCDGDSSNDVVTDNLTGLMWMRDTGEVSSAWSAARSTVDSLSLCGFNDWRLPNRKELLSTSDFSQFGPALKTGHPFSVLFASHWTSTNYVPNASSVWGLDLSGSSGELAKGGSYYSWPVRDTPNISLSPISLSFPDTNVGSTSAAQTFMIINSGTSNLTVSGIAKLDDGTMFNVTTGSGPDACLNLTPTLAPGGKCTMEVTFAPGLSCDRHASLDIQSNDPDAPHTYSALSGKGLVTLNVAINPPGGGTATGSSITGANIDCPGDCTEVYDTSVAGGVTLSPAANTGYLFTGWTGCNSVSGSQCNVVTDTNKTATASFTRKTFTVTVSAGANGTISPGTSVLEYGSNKAFDIIPNTGYRTKEVIVDGVSKGAAISISFTNIIGDHSITAVFEVDTNSISTEKSANLKVVKSGKGNGSIVPSLPGQSCGPDCIGYVTGQRVTVMARVESGSIYKGWTGCDSVSGNYCTVKMDKDKTVTANFEAAVPVISVSPEGPQDFGNVRVGRLRTRTLKITNNGTGNLRITSVEFDGENEEMFSKRSGSAIIKPGKSSNLRVMFKPRSAGEKTASLIISSNDPAVPVVKISLTGSGISK